MDVKRELDLIKQEQDANKQHVEAWKEQIAELRNFYFTFGSDPEFPYGRDDYVLIMCRDEGEACRLFNAVHPKRHKTNVMNCAFMYNEKQWEIGVQKYYRDTEPIETIIVTRRGIQ